MMTDFKTYSNTTWFFSPIKSTDTNWALFSDKSHFQIEKHLFVFFSDPTLNFYQIFVLYRFNDM